MPSSTAPPEATGRHQRSFRNYLLDAPFQLKYTGYLVAIAIILSVALGTLLWQTSDEVLVQSKTSVAQGSETVRRGKELVKTSQKLSAVVQMNIAEKYADSPDLAKVFNEGADKEQKRLEEEQARLESESARLLAHERDIERSQSRIMRTLLATLTALVLFIGAAGIVITHRIAGPIFKMKRQIRELGEGKLAMPGKLRKGDELVHFFQGFEDAVKSLRSQQDSKIAALDAAIAKAEAGDAKEAATQMKALRERLVAQLGLTAHTTARAISTRTGVLSRSTAMTSTRTRSSVVSSRARRQMRSAAARRRRRLGPVTEENAVSQDARLRVRTSTTTNSGPLRARTSTSRLPRRTFVPTIVNPSATRKSVATRSAARPKRARTFTDWL